ncbi:unnamed protein product, partial [Prorocentrum cordatum]
ARGAGGGPAGGGRGGAAAAGGGGRAPRGGLGRRQDRKGIVSMSSTGECILYGYSMLEPYGTSQAELFEAEPGWVWLTNSSTVAVQGLLGELDPPKTGEALVLKEITIGGPSLYGGVVHIAAHETTWYPPSGERVIILAEDMSLWSLPGVLETSVDHNGESVQPDRADLPMHVVHAKLGGFEMEVDRWNDVGATEKFMNVKIVKPVESSETGLCPNSEGIAVPDAEVFAVHHSPSPTGDTSAGAQASALVNSGGIHIFANGSNFSTALEIASNTLEIASNTSNASIASIADKSGTADTFLHFVLIWAIASSVVPFIM